MFEMNGYAHLHPVFQIGIKAFASVKDVDGKVKGEIAKAVWVDLQRVNRVEFENLTFMILFPFIIFEQAYDWVVGSFDIRNQPIYFFFTILLDRLDGFVTDFDHDCRGHFLTKVI